MADAESQSISTRRKSSTVVPDPLDELLNQENSVIDAASEVAKEPQWKEMKATNGERRQAGGCKRLSTWIRSFFIGSKDDSRVQIDLRNHNLDLEELEELQSVTVFTEREIQILRIRFASISSGKERIEVQVLRKFPEISQNPLVDQILKCFDDVDLDGFVSFREFINTMSVFSPLGPKDKKLHIAFRIHDFDGDEKISKEDLRQYLMVVTSFVQTMEELKEQKEREDEELVADVTSSKETRIDYNKQRLKDVKSMSKKEISGKSREDMVDMYIARIKFLETEGVLEKVVDHTFEEASADGKHITKEEFSRVIGHSDFHNKLIINLCENIRIVK